jgi:hypothetical protein
LQEAASTLLFNKTPSGIIHQPRILRGWFFIYKVLRNYLDRFIRAQPSFRSKKA